MTLIYAVGPQAKLPDRDICHTNRRADDTKWLCLRTIGDHYQQTSRRVGFVPY